MITGYIKGQNLTIRTPMIAADTIDYLTAQFVFQTVDWEGCRLFSHWKCGETNYTIELSDAGKIEKEQHLNLTAGTWTVWIHGERYRDGALIQRITTDEATLTVTATGTAGGSPFPEVPASDLERINAEIADLQDKVGSGGGGIGMLTVNATKNADGTLTTDYSSAEIIEHINAGGDTRLRLESGIHVPFLGVEDGVGVIYAVPTVSAEAAIMNVATVIGNTVTVTLEEYNPENAGFAKKEYAYAAAMARADKPVTIAVDLAEDNSFVIPDLTAERLYEMAQSGEVRLTGFRVGEDGGVVVLMADIRDESGTNNGVLYTAAADMQITSMPVLVVLNTNYENTNGTILEAPAAGAGSSSSGGALNLQRYAGALTDITLSKAYTYDDVRAALLANRPITLTTCNDGVGEKWGIYHVVPGASLGQKGIHFVGFHWTESLSDDNFNPLPDLGWTPTSAVLAQDGTITFEDEWFEGYAKQAEVDSLSEAIADKQPKTLVVTISLDTYGNLTADYTSKQIADYVASGGDVVAYDPDDLTLRNAGGDETEWIFDFSAILSESAKRAIYYVEDDGSVFWHEIDYDPNAVPLPETASVGQIFRVSEVDENGRVTAVEAVDPVQADMAQNDETKPDYVKNRLAWTDDPVETVLIEEQTVTVGDDLYAELNGNLVLEVGKTYTVNFNGTTYECVAYSIPDAGDFENAVFIGNAEHIGLSGGNGEPFAFNSYDDGSIYLDKLETGDYTISISAKLAEVHQIDEKYLPDTVVVKDEYSDYTFVPVDLGRVWDDRGFQFTPFIIANETVEINITSADYDYLEHLCFEESAGEIVLYHEGLACRGTVGFEGKKMNIFTKDSFAIMDTYVYFEQYTMKISRDEETGNATVTYMYLSKAVSFD